MNKKQKKVPFSLERAFFKKRAAVQHIMGSFGRSKFRASGGQKPKRSHCVPTGSNEPTGLSTCCRLHRPEKSRQAQNTCHAGLTRVSALLPPKKGRGYSISSWSAGKEKGMALRVHPPLCRAASSHLPSSPAAPAELLRVKLEPFEQFRQRLEAPLRHEVSLRRNLHHSLPNAVGYATSHRNKTAEGNVQQASFVSTSRASANRTDEQQQNGNQAAGSRINNTHDV